MESIEESMPKAGARALPKAPTGIAGLDEVTGGGLPRGRPTLVCGPAGCGKTLLAMEFLVRGITQFDEPGAFVAFEESVEDLVANVASLLPAEPAGPRGAPLLDAEVGGRVRSDGRDQGLGVGPRAHRNRRRCLGDADSWSDCGSSAAMRPRATWSAGRRRRATCHGPCGTRPGSRGSGIGAQSQGDLVVADRPSLGRCTAIGGSGVRRPFCFSLLR
jgi:hypothetical protein